MKNVPFFQTRLPRLGRLIWNHGCLHQKLVNQFGYLLGVSPIFRIMTDPAEQTLMKNEVYADLFNDYMQGKDAQLFPKISPVTLLEVARPVRPFVS